jgi:hypothetical protein
MLIAFGAEQRTSWQAFDQNFDEETFRRLLRLLAGPRGPVYPRVQDRVTILSDPQASRR